MPFSSEFLFFGQIMLNGALPAWPPETDRLNAHGCGEERGDETPQEAPPDERAL